MSLVGVGLDDDREDYKAILKSKCSSGLSQGPLKNLHNDFDALTSLEPPASANVRQMERGAQQRLELIERFIISCHSPA